MQHQRIVTVKRPSLEQRRICNIHNWITVPSNHGIIQLSEASEYVDENSKNTSIDMINDSPSLVGTTISSTNHEQDDIASSFERTRKQYEKMQQQQKQLSTDYPGRSKSKAMTNDVSSNAMELERERIYQSYIQLPATVLKSKCLERQMNHKGRKPDLAQRLTQDDMTTMYGIIPQDIESFNDETDQRFPTGLDDSDRNRGSKYNTIINNFAGLSPLSMAAQNALMQAQFLVPTPIQAKAIPIISSGKSAIIHAATGSGKTLAYLLPYTERLWDELRYSNGNDHPKVAFILLPTRELAAQVAGVATILAPPGTVRFVTRPMNMLSRMKQERADHRPSNENTTTRIYIGSAKMIYQSLYGDGRMPASPTSKPEAMYLLQNTEYLVLDEVDRLLGVVGGTVNHNFHDNKLSKSQQQQKSTSDNVVRNTHEKPAAILTAAVLRLSLGEAAIVAASATVGRPLRRELARCMGLTPQECPPIIRDNDSSLDSQENDVTKEVEMGDKGKDRTQANNGSNIGRAVTIPSTVRHYVVPVPDGTSPGKILTTAFTAIQSLGPQRRMLLVLTRNFGITTQNAIGALKHFQCQPEPISLLDALESEEGSLAMIETHRQVSGVSGVGGSQSLTSPFMSSEYQQHQQGYLLVTGEESVRGLHLDGLDVVLVASRSVGPDEYTHIAGRTGRAGRSGSVINIVNEADVNKVTAWEKMLNITFTSCSNPKAIRSMIEGRGLL